MGGGCHEVSALNALSTNSFLNLGSQNLQPDGRRTKLLQGRTVREGANINWAFHIMCL